MKHPTKADFSEEVNKKLVADLAASKDQVSELFDALTKRDVAIVNLNETIKNLDADVVDRRKAGWAKDNEITALTKTNNKLNEENRYLRDQMMQLELKSATMRGYIDRVQERETPANDVRAGADKVADTMNALTPHGRATLGADQPKWYWRAHKYGTNPYGLYGN